MVGRSRQRDLCRNRRRTCALGTPPVRGYWFGCARRRRHSDCGGTGQTESWRLARPCVKAATSLESDPKSGCFASIAHQVVGLSRHGKRSRCCTTPRCQMGSFQFVLYHSLVSLGEQPVPCPDGPPVKRRAVDAVFEGFNLRVNDAVHLRKVSVPPVREAGDQLAQQFLIGCGGQIRRAVATPPLHQCLRLAELVGCALKLVAAGVGLPQVARARCGIARRSRQ